MTWIDLVLRFSAQVTYWDAIVILTVYACWFDAKKCKQTLNGEASLHFLASKCPLTQVGVHYESTRVAYIIRMTIASQ